ncbi:protein dachsous-like [Alosa sapidissima]|uniref:protein dachsous-like n=1 Tax=Alosa sapidissima TaxID=34773 RepID=UPI001C09A1A3|nr:protein dachsous-like [Alosa sapidissima]
MGIACVFEVFLFVGVVFPYGSWCLPTTTTVNCAGGSNFQLGEIDEDYEGEVEILQGIPPGENLVLEAYLFPTGVTFLQLDYTVGNPTAVVRTKRPLDADALEGGGLLTYAVKCRLGMKNTRELNVRDKNDNPPVFQQTQYTDTVSETLGVDSPVLTVKAVDADVTDANNRLTYSIQAPVPSVFEMRADGLILLMERLNYNTGNHYTFTVEARDPHGLSDTATVTVDVTDFDNLNPYFDHTLYEATIAENQGGPLPSVQPATIKAQDGDTGINMTIAYSITAVAPSKYQANFAMDAVTGIISVTTPLDREEVSSINVQIKAAQQDDSFKTANALVVVNIEDVNDNAPQFDKADYSVAILENYPSDSFVLQAKVTDKDLGGFVGTIRLIPDSVPFAVSQDGIITVNTSADLDRETSTSIQFQVEAREDAPPNTVVTANVQINLLDVNDNSPQFGDAKYEGKVFANQTAGMLVVKVEASDPDEGANGLVTYSIAGGNQDGYFAIGEDTGEITLVKIIPLEENKVLQFSLYVTAKDGGDISRASSVVVDILAHENGLKFLQKTYHASVEEEMDGIVEVVKVRFHSNGPVPQVVTEGDKFSIDANGVLSTKVKLDYETKANYSVRLSLSDGTEHDEAVVEVEVQDVNDNSPVFATSSITMNVNEDIEVGENITTVTASDADAGYNGEVRYILQGNAGRFSVNGESGVISLAEPLDREQQDEFHIEVVAMDQGRPSRSATATVVIQVLDVNDNEPVFSQTQYYLTASELDEPGTLLATLIATDKDVGTNAEFTYRIAKVEPSLESTPFTLDPVTGALTLARRLDYGDGTRYTLAVEAVDKGTPTMTGNATVTVQVEDVNNNPPEFSRERYDVAVPENLAGGAVLVSLEVTDKDKGGFSNGYFVMTSDTFSINKMGAISLNSDATLDREKQDSYVLQVTAVDQPVDGLNATAQVNITVTDINDNNPEFLPLPSPISVAEGKYTDVALGVVCQIQAEDRDAGENGRVNISTSSYTDTFTFTEDGTLVARAELDRETKDSYDLVIIATDNGKPQRQTVTNIRVSVTDVNDNAPVFSMDTYSKNILSTDSKEGDLVLTVTATDKDAGNNSVITYSFASGASEYLSLNSETGDITLTSDLSNVTKDTLLNLTAKAEDHGTTPLSSTATVLIYIRTVSLEEGLTFASPTYNFSVAENKPKDSEVGTVMASSGSSLIDVSYNLKTHTDLFSVNTAGSVRTLVELDKEEKEFYVISVEATDTRVPPSTALAVVTVQVEDVNEVPVFDSDPYTAEIFSIAPFKDSVVKVKATDPDVGETLKYSLVEPSSMFAVEPSSGQVYVVSVAGESGKVSLQVKVEDQHGLYDTTSVEVTVKESREDNVVVISLNQPINIVEEKTSELEKSLERVLDWTVKVISIANSNGEATDRRALSSWTYVSFVAMDASGTVMSAKEVQNKLKDEEEKVQAELETVFGTGLEHQVEKGPGGNGSDSMVVILTLGILFGLTIVALVVVVTVSVIKFKKIKKDMGDSEKESFHIERISQSSSISDENEPAEKSEGKRTPQSVVHKASQDSKDHGRKEEEEKGDQSAF